jgi:hypothetical protein
MILMNEIIVFAIIPFVWSTYTLCCLLVSLTGYFAATNKVSIDDVYAFVDHLRFPLNLVYKIFLDWEPKRYMWDTVNIGRFPCAALIVLPICFFFLIFFSLWSITFIFEGINTGNGVLFLINWLLIFWIIGGTVGAFLVARDIKNFDAQDWEKPKRKKHKNSERKIPTNSPVFPKKRKRG